MGDAGQPGPAGLVLLTGTGLVPPDEYTLAPGHTVEIEIDGIGVLSTRSRPDATVPV